MALTGTVAIKQVTIPAGTAVGVLSALVGATAGNYTVLVYDPQSESLNPVAGRLRHTRQILWLWCLRKTTRS